MNGRTARRLAAVFGLGFAMFLPATAGATTNPAADVDIECVDKKAVATFNYSGMSPQWNLTATQKIHVDGVGKVKLHQWSGASSSSSRMSILIGSGRHTITASTVVTGAAGRVKAEARDSVRCGSPPPPPKVRATTARLIGPCGDPMYAAVFNNRKSDVASTFRWRYHQFGVGYVTLERKVRAGVRFRTGYKHVTGSTLTTIKAHGETLVRTTTAPGGNYAPCR